MPTHSLSYCVVLLLALAACGPHDTPGTERIDNVVRVFMHQADSEYSVLTQEPGSAELKTLHFYYRGPFRIIADVPQDSSMWVLVRRTEFNDGVCCTHEVTFHIHSPDDIDGAGWRRKTGRAHTTSGTTTVIQ